MITLSEKQHIVISAFRDGKSLRAISKETGINRRTVTKYVRDYEERRNQLLQADNNIDVKELTDYIVEKPKYNSANRSKRKLTDEIVDKIKYYLKENEQKRARGQAKQQKKKIDIYEALMADGYDISYPTVCNTIRKLTNKGGEAYIKAEYELGDICEFDWGEVKLDLGAGFKTYQMAVFTGAKGNFRYSRLFTKQDTACFNEAHALFFDGINGVYRTMVYDNMKVVIKKFVGSNEKEPTDNLLKLSMYYGFKFRFCNIRAGNEKGHVERSVEYVRRKAFAFRDSFESLEEANNYLEEVCFKLNNKPQKLNNNQTAFEILRQEKEWLLPKMPMYDAARAADHRVDKYSTITVDSCHYSVPEQHVGKMVFVKVYSDCVKCFYEGAKIAEHSRKLGFNEWSIKIDHYLETLQRKPGALASSTALRQANPRLQKIYHQYYIKKEKEFIDLIKLVLEKGLEKIEEAIKSLERISPLDISTDKIKAIVNRTSPQVSLVVDNTKCSETTQKSIEMLDEFNSLIPEASNKFKPAVIV
ncbi:IS21 family transposase [Peptococcaceae bacterium 1198_IL3148]